VGGYSHILAPTALRAWREDSYDITRILLTTIAGLLAQRVTRMNDTVTLCTRILLTAQDLHLKKIGHGRSGEVGGTRGGR